MQAFGVSNGGDDHIDLVSQPGKGRQIGRDHDRSHVLQLDVGETLPLHMNTHALQHVQGGADGEVHVVRTIPGPVQPHYQTVTDQLVAADPL